MKRSVQRKILSYVGQQQCETPLAYVPRVTHEVSDVYYFSDVVLFYFLNYFYCIKTTLQFQNILVSEQLLESNIQKTM